MSRIAVIGAGVFGAWTAWRLVEAGHRVTLIDAYGPANGRASSSDHSRVIRAGYGADALYSRWATAALRDWTWLSAATGQTLLTTTGALFLGEPGNPYIRDTHRTLSHHGLEPEWLEPHAIAARFPQLSIDGLGPAVFEPQAGVLRARAAVQAIVQMGIARGVDYLAARIAPMEESQSVAHVRTTDGSSVEADTYIMACGSWLPQMFPRAIGDRIRPTRQEVLYYGVPSATEQFACQHLPVWIDFEAGLYGIPDIDAQGFKIGIDRHGPPIDPDTTDRIVDSQVVESTRQWLGWRFPGLARAPILDSRVCQYENTGTGDFVIDRHPAWPNVWIVGGGSGHGFKHGPSVARHVVELISTRVEPHPRFSLANKTGLAQRTVY